jgi:2-C-methyl-D-erythritol 4-phosphate cytidylyltransferase / 2-C-methyl-D-erythritol 2,4-cyclodiphosphate synthase
MAISVAAVVVGAGRGARAGGLFPKQYQRLGGVAVIRRSLVLMAEHTGVGAVQPVIHPDDSARFDEAAAGMEILAPVAGGATRQASVRAGLEALEPLGPQLVLIHDAARPFASPDLVTRAIAAARAGEAAVPGLAVADTVKVVDDSGTIVRTLDRHPLRTIQTPQAFRFPMLLAAHRRANAEGYEEFTDDAAVAEWAGMKVTVFAGEAANVKLTTAEDFARCETALLGTDLRTGIGFDVHAFGEGDHVILAGVRITHSRGLVGHSDADVAFHALADAIFGALAEGDIGAHFPPTDERWRNAASDSFLAFAAERVRKRGGVIGHLDLTIVCEEPRIGPHRDAMRLRVAETCGITLDRIGVKATTSERLGFTGRREGIAALATATVRLPWMRT